MYKAQSLEKHDLDKVYAIKKFKPDKEGDVITYTGISQSAIREIAVGTLLAGFFWTAIGTERCFVVESRDFS